MKEVKKYNICYKCKRKKESSVFYEKGNRFINCADCRSERARKRETIKKLLEKEKKIRTCSVG
ncbi:MULTISPECIES: hypothetical protein [Cytobacillus]|uniref:Uncharacterized protein n=1 Tax=Cytobacillus oceanisediminis TaxID=665099 RepID=A0ABX3CMF0_9BACI|nr:hypothetical protein [Cytobacillus oceanisediminis]OHX44574.1 hypothetical protein BBV17_25455 [Cytobacillus oceanisediminis]